MNLEEEKDDSFGMTLLKLMGGTPINKDSEYDSDLVRLDEDIKEYEEIIENGRTIGESINGATTFYTRNGSKGLYVDYQIWLVEAYIKRGFIEESEAKDLLNELRLKRRKISLEWAEKRYGIKIDDVNIKWNELKKLIDCARAEKKDSQV